MAYINEYVSGSGGGGGSSLQSQGLLTAHFTGGTLHANGGTIKSYAISGSRLTYTFAAVASAEDGFREAGGYAIAITDVFPTFDPAVHQLKAWIDNPSNGTNAGIGIAVVSNPGTGAVGCGFYCNGASRAYSQSSTSATNGGGSGATTMVRATWTPSKKDDATQIRYEVNVFKADATATYAYPGVNELTGLTADPTRTDLHFFVSAVAVGAVVEDVTAVGTIIFGMEPMVATPSV